MNITSSLQSSAIDIHWNPFIHLQNIDIEIDWHSLQTISKFNKLAAPVPVRLKRRYWIPNPPTPLPPPTHHIPYSSSNPARLRVTTLKNNSNDWPIPWPVRRGAKRWTKTIQCLASSLKKRKKIQKLKRRKKAKEIQRLTSSSSERSFA